MYAHDWPLILFTLMLQMSAGGFIFLALSSLLNKELYKTSFFRKKMLWLFIISIAGLILAFFHLGSPMHAINALNNLGSSWMSLEILATCILIFTILLINLNLQNILKMHKGILALLYFTGLCAGVVLIYSMARIYHEPTITSWHKVFTWVEFIAAPIILGGLFVLTGLKNRFRIMFYILFVIVIIIAIILRMSFYASYESSGI